MKSCVDKIEIKLKATDDEVNDEVTCKGQGETNCKSTILNLNLNIRETNKASFCSKVNLENGQNCQELFQEESDRTEGTIPEYSTPEN